MSKACILIVEDEAPIREGLEELFLAMDCEVRCASDGDDGLAQAISGPIDVVLLDVMLPGLSGFEVLQKIREKDLQILVIMLTARGAEDDVVKGLQLGADDYVTKPFGVRELAARVEGLLTRRGGGHKNAIKKFENDKVLLDVTALELSDKNQSSSIRFTAKEIDLLLYLIEAKDRVVSREELLVAVWGYRDGSLYTRTVDVHIQKLREKIRQVPSCESWIQTIRAKGYRFDGELHKSVI